jgi:hypothetical protein
MELILLFIVLATTVWVGVDASGRDWSGDRFANSTTKWVISVLLLWIVVFPVYVARRGRASLKA